MTISALLRSARRRSGLSLRGLARRAGTSHSTIAAYEQGRKMPSAGVFLRLLQGCDLGIQLVASPRMHFDDPEERGRELEAVLGLAEEYPRRPAPFDPTRRFGAPDEDV